MDLVALADRQRRSRDGRFERRFLCVVVVLRGPVMEDRPALRFGNDHVFRQSHRCLLAIRERNVETRFPVPMARQGEAGAGVRSRARLCPRQLPFEGWIKSSEDARVWRTPIPAYRLRSGEYLRASALRFAQGRAAWLALVPAPSAPRFANPAGAEPRPSSCPSEKNTSGLILCLFGSRRWNRNRCGLRAGDRRRGTKLSACRFQFWRCSNEQREAYRRSASADGLGIAQADR